MSTATLQRRPLVKKILAGADDNLLVIAGLGSSNWDITEAGDRPLNMPLWGGMGAPVPMGLGLAIAQPTKRVLVITGDADLMMVVSTLATVAAQQPDNLAICVLDNEKFGETGNQASHTSPRNNGPTNSGAGTDLAMIAKGCGIADTGTVRAESEVAQLVDRPAPQERPRLQAREGDGRKARLRHAAAGWRASERSFPPSSPREAVMEAVMDYAPFPLDRPCGLAARARPPARQGGA